ncbi:hypothetical protein ATANTOWER_015788 [Ataeniobius toweri]|uniref:SAM domain-containing protein n=1 Tax=Ataeniobius toweri TaxID=208326 RepID=A0ABU7AYQ9_9TELE|nr:hypothetical protein [Ataeniobius toweri]
MLELPAVDEQNAQTQQQHMFTVGRTEQQVGLVEEEEEEDGEEDKTSLQSSFSSKQRSSRRVSKTPCEKLIHKGSLSLGSSASLPIHTGSRDNMPMLNTKILYPGSVSSGSVVSRLLVNADPFSCDADNMDCYTEKCVMNNYFGIGLDAKITLDFNNKRDEHPEKCRSRTKNMMWYGVLGTKELLHRTYKNLEQRVLLECDGRPIPLPSLQGIAVLNIPSYAGGTNFWGGTKEDDTFMAPSFDDKILEVVAVFGSMQMAVSRVINLQHHRIAQCRTVKITILGDEGVPVQVDGEAWIQPPGYIKIIHKNRTQTLTRDRAFENTLKSWEDKQKCEFPQPQHSQPPHPETVSEEEALLISEFGQAAGVLIHSIREVAQFHHSLEQELAHAVNASSKAMDVVYAKSPEALSCSSVVHMVSDVKALLSETELLLAGKMSMVTASSFTPTFPSFGTVLVVDCRSSVPPKTLLISFFSPRTDFSALMTWLGSSLNLVQSLILVQALTLILGVALHRVLTVVLCLSVQQLDPPQQDQLNAALGSVAQELRRLSDVSWLCPVIDPSDQEGPLADFSKRSQSGKFRLVSKFKKDKNNKNKEMCATLSLPVHQWGTEEVGAWLDFLCLSEYQDIFTGHDVRGAELIHLERRDLKDLGVTKRSLTASRNCCLLSSYLCCLSPPHPQSEPI